MFKDRRYRVIQDEQHIRQVMTLYAMNDCFSVPRLANHILTTEPPTPPSTVTYDEISDDGEVLPNSGDEKMIYLSPPIDADDLGVHVRDELPNDIEPPKNQIYEQKQEAMKKPLTRNQKKNRKQRANRYRHETIRNVYRRFTISNVKTILIDMNIRYVNMNMVGHVRFIGYRDEPTRKQVDELLHAGMFTKEHYYRIQKRSRSYERLERKNSP